VYLGLVIVIACVIVLHGRLQLETGIGWTGSALADGRITYSGIFDDPNDLGLLLVIAIAAVCYLFGLMRSLLVRLTLLAVLGWLLYGVMLTDSRGTQLAVLMVFMIHLWKTLGKKTLIVVALLAAVALSLGSRLAQMDPEEESAAGRIDAWIEGIGMLRHNPLFGVGYGNFTDYNPMTAHNTIVLAFAELGLLGYIVWLAIVGYSGYMLYWITYRARDWAVANGRELPANFADEVEAARCLLVAALGFSVGAFFLSQSFKPLLYVICGLAMGRWLGVAQRIGPLPQLSFLRDIKYWIAASIGSIVSIYALVKVAG
jgi:O-antigen ligase